MDWFRRGLNYATEAARREKAVAVYPPRVTFRKGETKKLIFIDGDTSSAPFWVVEHRKQVNNHWVYPVCQNSDIFLASQVGLRRRSEMSECYACDHGSNRYTVGLLTVIDVSGFEGRDGKIIKGVRSVYAGDMDACNELAAIAGRYNNSLVGCLIEITELGVDYGGCGTQFQVTSNIPPERWPAAQEKLKADTDRYPWEPFDYPAFTRVMSNEDMRRLWVGERLPDPSTDGEILYM